MRESCEFGYYYCGEEWLEGGFDQERDESKAPSPGKLVVSIPGRMVDDKGKSVMFCYVRSFCCQKHLQEFTK